MHLSVPNDVLDARTDAQVRQVEIPTPTTAKIPPELVKAKRPLVIAGPAAMRARRMGGMPVIGMESPRGVNDPSLGKLAEVLAKADVVLLLGKPLDFTLKFGKAFAPDCRILNADPAQVLPDRAWRSAPGSRKSSRLALPAGGMGTLDAAGAPLHPVEVCREVQKLLDAPDAVFVSDGGEFGQWAQACLRAPRRVINGVAGSIGSALPFAAAAKLAFPDAPVVALLGDGTLGFHLSEIDTAVRYGIGYVAVIGNDACWNAEYQIQLAGLRRGARARSRSVADRYGSVASALGRRAQMCRRQRDWRSRCSVSRRPASRGWST